VRRVQGAMLQQVQGARRPLVLIASLVLLAGSPGHTSPAAGRRHLQLTLWAWERPEDLRFLAGRDVRVAVLDRTIALESGTIEVHLRHQALRVAPATSLVSVVRVETHGSAPSTEMAPEVALEIVRAGRLPRADSVQIDFDARSSDRPFYTALLHEVRARLPASTRLSMTALASWCAEDPWIDTREVDEVVPMLFQMGSDARRIVTRLREDGRFSVAACNDALGLATDEPWRGLPTARRVYLFNPGPWREADLAAWIAGSLE
jgi:Protein of unknown function (DUF3142)